MTPKEFIDSLTPEDFRQEFSETHSFPFLNCWNEETIYYREEEVYYVNRKFYVSLTDENINNEPDKSPANWELIEDEVSNYITDAQIEKAMMKAKLIYEPNHWHTEEAWRTTFLLLVAHYLVISLKASNNPLAIPFVISSKSVGSVSASYGIPDYILSSRGLSFFTNTLFGLEFLSFLLPFLPGAGTAVVCGTTNAV